MTDIESTLWLEWRTPQELAENPANWRRHPDQQLSALTGSIESVGWAGACLFNERTGRLIDGHARRKVALEQGSEKVPVLVGNWSEEQEKLILATLDPLAAMADTDQQALDALLAEIETDNDGLNELLDQLAKEIPEVTDAELSGDQTDQLNEQFQIIVTCPNEQSQAKLLARLTKEGFECRSLIS